MTKNSLLNTAILASRLIKIIFIIGAIVITGLFVYIQIDSNAFANSEINLTETPGGLGYYKTVSEISESTNKELLPFTLNNLETISIYVYYIKVLLILFLGFMSFKTFEKIMLSVKSLNTFTTANVKLFRNIGKYIFGIVVLTSYSILRFKTGTQIKLNIELLPLLLAFLFFILAEIFKEGSDLKQENDLTI